MDIIREVLEANERFVRNFVHGDLEAPPSRNLAVVTCMDARLSMERMLGLSPGEAHILRNAGGIVTEDVIRSLIVSHHLLGTRRVMIINHTECGMMKYKDEELRAKLVNEFGTDTVSPAHFHMFEDLEENVRRQIQRLTSHPWIPKDLFVMGFIYNVRTGRLSQVPETGDAAGGKQTESECGAAGD